MNPEEKKEKYIPINCAFYSKLELYALRKQPLKLKFKEGKKTLEKEIVIKTLQTKNHQEFLITTEDWQVRLDKIISVQNI